MEDILIEGDDVKIANGDLATGDSQEQSVSLTLNTSKGEWKQTPRHGVGVTSFLEMADTGNLAREIQTQLTQDGARVRRIVPSLDNIEVEASYE